MQLISPEDLLANAISSKSEIGKTAVSYLESSKPIPCGIYIDLISERMNDPECSKSGWVLDGFPHTTQDLEAYQRIGSSCDAFIFLDVPTPALIGRVDDIRRDPETNKKYHIKQLDLNLDSGVVERLVKVESDCVSKISNRIDEYFGDISEVLNFFEACLFHVNANRAANFVRDEILCRLKRALHRPVIFVVGIPGSGKRTNCDMIATNEGYIHLCPKDLITQEQYFDTDISNEIERITSRGQDVPSKIIIELLKTAMVKAESKKYIIDNFPRNVEDLECWYNSMSALCSIDFVVHLQCPNEVVLKRACEVPHQTIPSMSSITKKYKQFCEESMPFVSKMRSIGRTRTVSTAAPIAVVGKKISNLVHSLSLIPPYERTLCIIKPDAVNNGDVPAILAAINNSQFAVVFTKFVTMSKEVIDDFFTNYCISKSKLFKKHRNHMQSGPSLVAIIEGSDAIRRLQELIGNAEVGLRSQYGTDSVRDAFYCSSSEQDAMRDIDFWINPNESTCRTIPDASSGYSVEDTLALVKPGFSECNYDEISSIIAGHGFEIVSECRFHLTPAMLSELYPEMKSNHDYSKATEYLLSGPVVAFQLRRESALKGWRHLMGSVDLKKTQEERFDSIRDKFALNMIENAVHGSYNSLLAKKELGLCFPMLNFGENVLKCTPKAEKPRTARRRKKKIQGSSSIKPASLQSYLKQDVNPVINDLVKNLAIQKPKDIMGYAIKELIEKQKMDFHKVGPSKKKALLSSSLSSVNFDHHCSSEKSVMDGIPLESNEKVEKDLLTVDTARMEITRLQETINALSANIVDQSDVKRTSFLPLCGTASENSGDRVLEVLSFGDLVGFGTNHSEMLKGNSIACLSAAIKKVKKDKDALVLFTGNFLGCSHTIDSTHYSSTISLIDNLGINYGILGNRDLDFGWIDVHNHLKFSQVTWIASNIIQKENKRPFKNCEERILVEWNGIQVGIIGIIDDWASKLSSENIEILDPVDTSKRLCSELKEEGAEVVLVMSHCDNRGVNERLSLLSDVQVVICGHENGMRSWQLNKSSLGVANGGLSGICKLSIAVSDQKLPIVSWPPQSIVITNERQPYDVIDSIVMNLREEYEANLLMKLGFNATTLCAQRQVIRSSETNLGSLLTDMMREYCDSSIAVLNSGAVCVNGDISPGLLTIGDIVDMLPYEDSVVTVRLTGQQIVDMLNNSVSRAPSPDGRFLQVSGLSFDYRVDDPYDRNRCFNVHIGNQALNLEELYTCSMTGWILEQNDGYKCLNGVKSECSKELCPSLVEVVFSYFDKRMLSKAQRYYRELNENDFEPIDAHVDSRINVVGNFSSTCHTLSTNLDGGRSGSSTSSDGPFARTKPDNNVCNDDKSNDEMLGIDFGAPSDKVLSDKF